MNKPFSDEQDMHLYAEMQREIPVADASGLRRGMVISGMTVVICMSVFGFLRLLWK